MRFDEYGAGGHPYLETPHIDALAASGATFSNAYHTTPLCSPNRACILTGQYASRHGIIDNTSRSYASHRLRTFARELQRAGYETAHVGKWHMGNDPTPRPGYDHWVSFAGQGDITDPELFENGRLQRVPGYITDLLTDRAIEFATRARRKPFMVYIGHKAIHPQIVQRDDGTVDVSTNQGFVPAARHRGKYAGKVYQRRANYGLSAQDRASKPVLAAALEAKHSGGIARQFGAEVLDEQVSEATIQARAEMMLAVDEGVGRLCAALEEKALLENTLFVFMSDNGSFFGEHGLSVERRFPYEESIKSPLIISHRAAIEPRRDRCLRTFDRHCADAAGSGAGGDSALGARAIVAAACTRQSRARSRSLPGGVLRPRESLPVDRQHRLPRGALRSIQIHSLDTRGRGA